MIILRVIMGRGWSNDAAATTMRFTHSTAVYGDRGTRLQFPRATVTEGDLEVGTDGPAIGLQRISPPPEVPLPRSSGSGDVKIYDLSSTDGHGKGRDLADV